jgi:hypothetical protein
MNGRRTRALRHSVAARDQVDDRRQVGEQDQEDHPDGFDPAGCLVITPEQVGQDVEQDHQVRDEREDDDRRPQEMPERIPHFGYPLNR